MAKSIAIVGDFDPVFQPHVATNEALEHCAAAMTLPIEYRWFNTKKLAESNLPLELADSRGMLIAPGSPYESMLGALAAIRFSREHGIPLLGTCGGFQHMILEYARNVLGIEDAQHAEYDPNASRLFISKLACSLAGRTMTINLRPDSLVASCYGRTQIEEEYYCNFGVNPDHVADLQTGALRIVGSDDEGEMRVIELPNHPFFVGTLFVPQISSTANEPHPLICAFIRASLEIRNG